jgi:Tol biopolymer transport system component
MSTGSRTRSHATLTPRLVKAIVLFWSMSLFVLPPTAYATFPGSNGVIAYSRADIYVVNPDGSGITNLTNFSDGENKEPSWSPDGTMVAFATARDGNFEIYVMDSDGANQGRLTTLRSDDEWPAWSPDGRFIVFSRTSGSSGALMVMRSDGTGLRRLIGSSSHAPFTQPSWSPDGAKLLFSRIMPDFGDAIFVVNSNGSGLTQLTDPAGGVDQYPDWSPDGTEIVFSHRFAGETSIWVMNADGSNQTQILGDFNDHPAWSPDGTRIVFQRLGPSDSWDIWTMDTDGTDQTPVVQTGSDEEYATWQPIP